MQLKLDSNDDTLSGRIEFDRFGMRKNYDVTVIDLVSSTKSAFNRKEVNYCLRQNSLFYCYIYIVFVIRIYTYNYSS